jgi:L-histidine Nalpha-methyltransferase
LTDDADAVRAEVWRGLSRPQKETPPKFFYDAAGAALFDRITRLDEYYLTRAERALLHDFGRGWLTALGARALIELGAGSADKTRVLLDALAGTRAVYVPVDISDAYLERVAAELRDERPQLQVLPLRADITRPLHLPASLPEPAVVAFLGSTIGNFPPAEATRLLSGIAASLRPADRLLLGADLVKDRATLERAYNDAAGVTAKFNRNVLRVLNRETGTDFDAEAFDHRAFYDDARSRIEMHLVARRPQRVHVPGYGDVCIAAGETIRTETSAKYDRGRIEELLESAGLVLELWHAGDDAEFALVVARRR